ncbi:hypothetical protein BH23BAC1_BH23BAC1_11360 [soil metagenome]
MGPLFLGIAGIVILLINSIDFILTTLLVGRGGPFTSVISKKLWQFFLFIHKKTKSHRFLSLVGTLLILVNLSFWIISIWVGWFLIFNISPDSVLRSDTLLPADSWAKFYFIGFSIITLGVGDYQPGSDLWRVLTILVSLNGLIFLTLAITYLLSVVSAVVDKRAVAAYISSLGYTPEDIITRSFQNGKIDNLTPHFNALTPKLLHLAQEYLAYPILHSFHSPRVETAIVLSVAALDEALTTIEHGISPELKIPSTTIFTLRRAITLFIATQNHKYYIKNINAPLIPDLQVLKDYGIPVAGKEKFNKK